ncbi:hypothetical protein F8388_009114 [Cannabis sativa]|uniref:Uncharacterized protein n=1 Tax=Cannabis sativa TaxID=3483 RepID=A0A7J6F9Z6_CANSA|nr:hypothetical protein G4B88_003708 [Cannabis sativa]KAF4383083.1 hypothetical protein F8388_009114 [Cannabis sativa]
MKPLQRGQFPLLTQSSLEQSLQKPRPYALPCTRSNSSQLLLFHHLHRRRRCRRILLLLLLHHPLLLLPIHSHLHPHLQSCISIPQIPSDGLFLPIGPLTTFSLADRNPSPAPLLLQPYRLFPPHQLPQRRLQPQPLLAPPLLLSQKAIAPPPKSPRVAANLRASALPARLDQPQDCCCYYFPPTLPESNEWSGAGKFGAGDSEHLVLHSLPRSENSRTWRRLRNESSFGAKSAVC